MIDRGGLGRRLRGRRSRRDHPVSPVPGRYRCPRPLSSGLPRRAAPAARSHAAGPTGLPGALPFPRGGGGPTTGVLTAAAPRDARRAGITAAAGTRPCPRLRGGGCGPASLAHSPSLPRARALGKFRACCRPWMCGPSLRPALRSRTLILRQASGPRRAATAIQCSFLLRYQHVDIKQKLLRHFRCVVSTIPHNFLYKAY